MGQFVSRIHNKQDGKLYNILPTGDMPTVVFGRVIREHSVPGMQYYFADGQVKYLVHQGKGYLATIPIVDRDSNALPCIFTVPEDLDFSRMGDVEYVRQFSKSAIKLNANTVSPDFIIREGEIICVKKDINQYVRIRYHKNRKSKRRGGNRYITTSKKYFNSENKYHSREIIVFPVGSRRPSALSMHNYTFVQRFKARGSYNIMAHTYDGEGNICYFRASKIKYIGNSFRFRCSEFTNLDDDWRYVFDFDNTLKYNDYLIVKCSQLCEIKTGDKRDFYNERTDNNIPVYIDEIIGDNKISKKWVYYQKTK